MTGYVLASLVFLGGVLIAVLGELINEEMRGWIDYLPRVILRLAATRLDPARSPCTKTNGSPNLPASCPEPKRGRSPGSSWA